MKQILDTYTKWLEENSFLNTTKEVTERLPENFLNYKKKLKLVLNPGDKVHYVPYKDCDPSKYENGIVKSLAEHSGDHVRVVFHCAGDWDKYMDYTSALTSIENLREGWYGSQG